MDQSTVLSPESTRAIHTKSNTQHMLDANLHGGTMIQEDAALCREQGDYEVRYGVRSIYNHLIARSGATSSGEAERNGECVAKPTETPNTMIKTRSSGRDGRFPQPLQRCFCFFR